MNAAEYARSQGWEVGTVLQPDEGAPWVRLTIDHIGAEYITLLANDQRPPVIWTGDTDRIAWHPVVPDTLTPRIEAGKAAARYLISFGVTEIDLGAGVVAHRPGGMPQGSSPQSNYGMRYALIIDGALAAAQREAEEAK